MKGIFFLIVTLFVVSNIYSQDKVLLNTYWNNGLKFKSSDNNFSSKIGGRIMLDAMFINQDDSLNRHFDAEKGIELRRARLYTSGKVYKTIKYKFQLEFTFLFIRIDILYLFDC